MPRQLRAIVNEVADSYAGVPIDLEIFDAQWGVWMRLALAGRCELGNSTRFLKLSYRT
jgi:hypothetical protein